MEYDNTDRGVLFKNDRKEKDSHPDYKGSINVSGEEFWLSAWIKDGQKGKFMSLSVSAKEQAKPTSGGKRASAPTSVADLEDDIPFARLPNRYDI